MRPTRARTFGLAIVTAAALIGLGGSASAAPLCTSCQTSYEIAVAKCKGLHPPAWNKCQSDASNRKKFCLAHCVKRRPGT